MNVQNKAASRVAALVKADPSAPCIKLLGDGRIAIKAGTVFNGFAAGAADVMVPFPERHPIAGRDYCVVVDGGVAIAEALDNPMDEPAVLGGFHYAPGGNAPAALPSEARSQRGEKSLREGGDSTPQINPCSIWDRNFRPACSDPRGMTLVDMPAGRKFWCDIYLLGKDHLKVGTSKFGITIADGDDAPQNPEGGSFKSFDYAAAKAVFAHHGKQLLSYEEFYTAAYGGKERSSVDDDPETTQIDARRTSKFGVMQPFGSMWQWGHDGDPDEPRPSVFGGSWLGGSSAGSRCALLGYWPGYSYDDLGARGRSDHLQLG